MSNVRELENQKQAAYETGQNYGYRGEWVEPSTLNYFGEVADAFRDGFQDAKESSK